jgi:transcriptional regulator of acetoin/glycerol metabolism
LKSPQAFGGIMKVKSIGVMEESYYTRYRQWEVFMETGIPPNGVRPFIASSWLRCRALGVLQDFQVSFLSLDDLRDKLEQHRDLLEIAHPIITKIFSLVETSQYIMSIHDNDGYMIDYIYNENYFKPSNDFSIGVKWEETIVGTNGVSLARKLDQSVQVMGPEHYCKRQHKMTCSAAPIHDEKGGLIGVLNMTGPFEKSNPHTLGLVASGAFAIENQLALFHSHTLINDTFEFIDEGIIILDNACRVQRVNQCACRILKMSADQLYCIKFLDLFNPHDFKRQVFEKKSSFSYFEHDFKQGHTVTTCNVSVTPMLLHNKVSGIIILLRESKTINRITNKVNGNKSRYVFSDIITQDREMKGIIQSMRDVVDLPCTILIEGESGTGKELLAHSIHGCSVRRGGPFIVINCASLPRSLVESELFGYEKGSFTGALNEGSPGKFELANGGTIFLDEIEELPLEMQAKLLRVLDNHRIVRIGGNHEKTLDVRVIVATNRNLFLEVQKHNFRDDLYFRINVMRFSIPPLRRRYVDIPLLVEHIISELNNQDNGFADRIASAEFIAALEKYHFPGNVRELQNIVVRAYYINRTNLLVPGDLPDMVGNTTPETGYIPAGNTYNGCNELNPNDTERRWIEQALSRNGRNAIKAGASIGMSKSTIYRKIKKFGILI